MKKYALFLFILAFALTVNVDSVNAQVTGCTSSGPYNTLTGQPCETTTIVAGCLADYLFSSITGQSCGNAVDDTDTVNSVSYEDLTIGSRGDIVKTVQQILKDDGYSLETIDGIYDRQTARAVSDFQHDNDLPVTGIVDALTLAKLNAIDKDVDEIDQTSEEHLSTLAVTNNSVPSISRRSGGGGRGGGGGGGGSSTLVAPATTKSSISIVSPNGGEEFAVGNTMFITWKSENIDKEDRVSIELLQQLDEDEHYGREPIALDIPNDGVYKWVIPSTLPEDNRYVIKIQGPNGAQEGQMAADFSDNTFSILGGKSVSVDLNSASVALGDDIRVTVDLTSTDVSDLLVERVLVQLDSLDSGEFISNKWAIGVPGTNEWIVDFTIPTTVTPGVWKVVRISVFDSKGVIGAYDHGLDINETFKIVDITSTPVITIVSPNGWNSVKIIGDPITGVDDQVTFDLSFDVTAQDGDVYIDDTCTEDNTPNIFNTTDTGFNFSTINENDITTLACELISPSGADRGNGNFIVREDETETFNITIVATASVASNFAKVTWKGLNWNDQDAPGNTMLTRINGDKLSDLYESDLVYLVHQGVAPQSSLTASPVLGFTLSAPDDSTIKTGEAVINTFTNASLVAPSASISITTELNLEATEAEAEAEVDSTEPIKTILVPKGDTVSIEIKATIETEKEEIESVTVL